MTVVIVQYGDKITAEHPSCQEPDVSSWVRSVGARASPWLHVRESLALLRAIAMCASSCALSGNPISSKVNRAWRTGRGLLVKRRARCTAVAVCSVVLPQICRGGRMSCGRPEHCVLSHKIKRPRGRGLRRMAVSETVISTDIKRHASAPSGGVSGETTFWRAWQSRGGRRGVRGAQSSLSRRVAHISKLPCVTSSVPSVVVPL
ncbi:hypothetical protein B5X24_HaOG215652 [Helicoverpa armigera]|uniref:Uncharacterized protein n=1 Tax=Helicoverpa armigera TaxID=29058 RepID=A0A2W1AZX1_HELAM|nr:hypothetical protein B5X24_HaOG215652 [Helicoverpa armigera]